MDENQKAQNLGLEKLKKIGVNEISKLTHIEVECLKSIFQSDFESLLNYNTAGMIKILQREFEVDLSSWLEDFENFKNEHQKTPRNTINKPLSQKSTREKKRINWTLWLFILAILVFVIFYFKLYENPLISSKFSNEKNEVVNIFDNSVVDKTEQTLKNIGVEVPNFDENQSNEILDTNLSLIELKDENQTKLNALDKSILVENLQTQKDENQTIKSQNFSSAFITSQSKIWIGVIDLNSGEKIANETTNSFKIDTSKHLLILTGHGIFTLKNGENDQNFNEKSPVRLLVENGEISVISPEKF